MAERPFGRKELVQAGLSGCIISPCGDQDLEVSVTRDAVCAVQQGELCQRLKAGNVGLCAFGQERPGLADLCDVPGLREPGHGCWSYDPATDTDRGAFGAGIRRREAVEEARHGHWSFWRLG